MKKMRDPIEQKFVAAVSLMGFNRASELLDEMHEQVEDMFSPKKAAKSSKSNAKATGVVHLARQDGNGTYSACGAAKGGDSSRYTSDSSSVTCGRCNRLT